MTKSASAVFKEMKKKAGDKRVPGKATTQSVLDLTNKVGSSQQQKSLRQLEKAVANSAQTNRGNDEEEEQPEERKEEEERQLFLENLLNEWRGQDYWKNLAQLVGHPYEKEQCEVPDRPADGHLDLGLAQYKLYVSKGEETKKGCEHDCKLSHAEHRHLKSFAEKRKQEPFPPLANNDFKSAKALFGCNYEVGPRTDPKRLEKAITDLLDVRSNKKTKNARLSLEGNWTEETGFEKGVDLKVLRQLLTRWEAQSRLLDEPWPFKDNELCMENLWRAHRAETDVVELLLKRNSPLEKLTQDQVSVWWPIVGEKTANVTFKPAHKRHKDLKVLLCNFPNSHKASTAAEEP